MECCRVDSERLTLVEKVRVEVFVAICNYPHSKR